MRQFLFRWIFSLQAGLFNQSLFPYFLCDGKYLTHKKFPNYKNYVPQIIEAKLIDYDYGLKRFIKYWCNINRNRECEKVLCLMFDVSRELIMNFKTKPILF